MKYIQNEFTVKMNCCRKQQQTTKQMTVFTSICKTIDVYIYIHIYKYIDIYLCIYLHYRYVYIYTIIYKKLVNFYVYIYIYVYLVHSNLWISKRIVHLHIFICALFTLYANVLVVTYTYVIYKCNKYIYANFNTRMQISSLI